MSTPEWIIGSDVADPEGGLFIVHVMQPGLVGRWRLGVAPANADYVDCDDEDVAISIHDTVWHSPVPDEIERRHLMKLAVKAIDEWLGAVRWDSAQLAGGCFVSGRTSPPQRCNHQRKGRTSH